MQIQHRFGIREVTLRHPKFLCVEESLLRKTCAITFTLLIFTAMSRGQIPKSGNAFLAIPIPTDRLSMAPPSMSP